MPKFVRTLPFSSAALVFVFFEIVYLNPKLVFWAGAAALLIFFIVINLTMNREAKIISSSLQFLIVPALLTWSALAFSLLIEAGFLRHLLAIISAVLLALFFESVLIYRFKQEEYKSYSLENLTTYALTVTVFLLSGALMGLRALLDIHLGLIAIIFLLGVLVVNYKFFWISRVPTERFATFAGVLTLVLLELFLVFALLPFHLMVSAAALTVLWYVGALLSRAHLLGLLTTRMVYRHLALGGILLVLLLLTAQWM